MRFNIISNLTNGVGLQQDYLLLKAALEKRGHAVRGVQFNTKPVVAHPADINIFLEVVNLSVFRAAPTQWAVPNPEWWFAKWDECPWNLILAKTRDCERIFTQKFGSKCQYLGWTARDLYQPSIKRTRRFLHVAGKSRFKNTQAVVAGCLHAKVPLTLVGDQGFMQPVGAGRITRPRVSDVELAHLMNSHFCHVMPSGYEGYGQVIHEAQACGQIVITTDAAPMNELTPAVLVPSSGVRQHHAAGLHKVEAIAVTKAVLDVLGMSDQQVEAYREDARAHYQQACVEFHQRLDALLS